MISLQFQNKLLKDLYDLYVAEDEVLMYESWANENGLSLVDVDLLAAELIERRLAMGGNIRRNLTLTSEGVRWLENSGLIERSITDRENRIRNQIILALGPLREQHGPHFATSVEQIGVDLSVDQRSMLRAVVYLKNSDLVSWSGVGMIRLTALGTSEYRRFCESIELGRAFKELLSGSVNAQRRGHELERLVSDQAVKEGWEAPTNVCADGEENDVILLNSATFAAFIVSCKWEKKPAKTDYLFSLRARMRLRPGSNGILISMGGFGEPLVRNSQEVGEGLVLLFGPTDIESIFNGRMSFTDSLQKKWVELIKHRKAIWR